jgi:hypothetical protein
VENVFAVGDHFWPSLIVFEIGGDERQAIALHGAAFLQHGAHLALALQAPHCGAYLMTDGHELQDEWLPMKPDPPGTRTVLNSSSSIGKPRRVSGEVHPKHSTI